MIATADNKATARTARRSGTKLIFFDENVIRISPAGSCVLLAMRGLDGEPGIEVYCNRLEPGMAGQVKKRTVPLPRGPVLARSVLFTIFACCAYALRPQKHALKISTQGVFPFCDVAYAHCCHGLFLSRYRSHIGGGILRRTARLLNHAWGAVTERIGFRAAKLVIVPSRGLARELGEAYGKLVAGKIRVLPNPVDTKHYGRPEGFSAAQFRSELAVPEGAILFSFCALGNFEWKGLRLALEALSTLQESRAHLVVIGGGKGEIAEYARVAEKLGVASKVRFAGLQSDIRPFLWASDAFLFPSAYETFPLVCLQAAAAGLPLLTTPLYGVEEFAAGGETGWTMDRSVESIAAAMRCAIAKGAELAQLGNAARARALGYGVDKFQAKWRALIDELLSVR
ncbi:MAG: glycosyltransferase family 4 protein [Acidobacteriaceae bacterium]|nr:glycosyltransferase family 4 protein [Acidobacteriaceae bacterium]